MAERAGVVRVMVEGRGRGAVRRLRLNRRVRRMGSIPTIFGQVQRRLVRMSGSQSQPARVRNSVAGANRRQAKEKERKRIADAFSKQMAENK